MKTRDSIIDITALLQRPGASRQVDVVLPPPEDLNLPLAALDSPIRFSGVLERLVNGLLVRGTLETSARLSCARCLLEYPTGLRVDVVELFKQVEGDEAAAAAQEVEDDADEVLDPGYEILDGRIDIETMVRDALLPALPYRPLCRADCAGLCVECGTNLNETACSCEDEVVDPRWAALEGLRLPDNNA